MDDPKIQMEHVFRLPGDEMRVELTCFFPGTIPSAFIVNEPQAVTPAWSRLKAQVELLNALRRIGVPRYLTLIVEADKACHDILLPALNLMTIPAAKRDEVAA